MSNPYKSLATTAPIFDNGAYEEACLVADQNALDFAGNMAGEYLDSVSQTDLSRLSPDEWQTFLRVVCHNYHQKLSELRPCPF